MKLTIIFLTVGALHLSATGVSQSVTFSGKNIPLESVFSAVEQQTPYLVFYSKTSLLTAKPITLKVKNMPLLEFLDLLFKDQPYTYSIKSKTINVLPKTAVTASSDRPSSPLSGFLTDNLPITGRITDAEGKPLEGATVMIKKSKISTVTNSDGVFSLNVNAGDMLVITYVGYEPKEYKITPAVVAISDRQLNLKLTPSAVSMTEVTINTGYQKIPRERATGSFEFVNKEQIERRVGTNILSRLEGVTTGLLFDRRQLAEGTNTSIIPGGILIRGLSTLGGSSVPLIVLNDLPYDGDINNINPNDVESITILKDAAAASIWGARAGNGVIVITTRQAKYNQPTKLTVNANVNVIEKPNLFFYPRVSSSDFIDVETFLFNKGFYNGRINSSTYPGLSPIVEILQKRRLDLISSSDSASQVDALRLIDVRDDFEKYIYRRSVNTQYFFNLSGGGEKLKYSLSGGVDKNPDILRGNELNRTTFRLDNSYVPVKRLEIQLGLGYTVVKNESNSLGNFGSSNYDYGVSEGSQVLYPYARLVDATTGTNSSIPRDYREGYTDTAGNGKLLDWKYRPLDELLNGDNTSKSNDILFNIGTTYKLANSLSVQAFYQYQQTSNYERNNRSNKTYFTRDLINQFTQIQDANVINIIPNGGILDETFTVAKSQAGRIQLNLSTKIKSKHDLAAIVGTEIRDRNSYSSTHRTYGYNEDNLSTSNVDYVNLYPLYGDRGSNFITNLDFYQKLRDRFVSFYGNGAYTYDNRYTVSISARKDASNLFGIDIKNKWKPLWSVGGMWDISNESFYKLNFLKTLKARFSYGYQGNVNNTLSPYVILEQWPANISIINQPYAVISQPANPKLSWETIKQVNIGVDFTVRNNRVSGSIDFYNKKSANMIYPSEVDPTTGILTIASNSASLSGKGIDVRLTSNNLNGSFKWSTTILFSYVTNKVIDYKLSISPGIVQDIVGQNGISRITFKGDAPYSIYSLPYAGLDALTGDPIGYLGKEQSEDYYTLLNQRTDTANLINHGTTIPPYFGFFNNSFEYKGFSLGVCISYKFDYYFRKKTINYGSFFRRGQTNADFLKRWQNSGDELTTTVPSMPFPINNNRDAFYAGSSANILPADHIRIEYVRFGYSISKSRFKRLPVKNVEVNLNISNLGIIWRANKQRLDPDFNYGNANFPPSKNISAGIKLEF